MFLPLPSTHLYHPPPLQRIVSLRKYVFRLPSTHPIDNARRQSLGIAAGVTSSYLSSGLMRWLAQYRTDIPFTWRFLCFFQNKKTPQTQNKSKNQLQNCMLWLVKEDPASCAHSHWPTERSKAAAATASALPRFWISRKTSQTRKLINVAIFNSCTLFANSFFFTSRQEPNTNAGTAVVFTSDMPVGIRTLYWPVGRWQLLTLNPYLANVENMVSS